jgi:DedD protein
MQRDSAADIELNLKKRARRRLVGAIALVAIMVVLLPMLLEDRSSLVPHDEVKITIQNEHTKDLDSSSALSEFDSNVVPADREDSVETSAAEPSAAETQSQDDGFVEPFKPALVEKEVALAPAVPQAKAKISAPTNLAKTNNAKEQYFVQIGVFSDLNNVKQMQSKLSGLGYKSSTEKIATPKGEKIRLRSQVFTSRNEAAIALQNIKASGLTGMVVSQ